MKLAHAIQSGAVVLSLDGRLDHESCDAFTQALQPHLDAAGAGKPAIVVDLERLDYVSSAGLRCFMVAAKQAKAQGGRIVLAALQPVVAEIFQISRFNLLFEIFPGVGDALVAVKPA